MPRYFVTLIVAVALFMETMDSTVIATSLPAIAKDLGEDPIALKLALTSYLLSFAVFIPLSGWVADRFGARTVFSAAIVVFTLGSAACGFASSLLDFVLSRIVQGIGGAMMVPVGRLVILRTVPKIGADLGARLAHHSGADRAGDRAAARRLHHHLSPPGAGSSGSTFPIGVLGVILATLLHPEFPRGGLPPLDVKGFILSGIGLSGLAFGFTTIGQGLLPPAVVAALLIVGFIGCWLYVRHARTAMRRSSISACSRSIRSLPAWWAASSIRVGIGATPFLLPLLLQLGFGLTPFQSGMLTFSTAVGAIAMKTTAAPILRRFGFKQVLVINALVSAIFIGVPAMFTPITPHGLILPCSWSAASSSRCNSPASTRSLMPTSSLGR